MNFFNGANKTQSYFEGWYFKHSNESESLALIPGMHIDKSGSRKAFIQVVTNYNSFNITYDYDQFYVSNKKFLIIIGDNYFSDTGIKINIKNDSNFCFGEIKYSNFTPVKYTVMGPFCLLPFMECNHGIISVNHKLQGNMQVNHKNFHFKNGIGYIEKDWGCSFPKKYFWVQCNHFNSQNLSIMASVAQIPILGKTFTGCVCIISFMNKEYRLATYLCAKVQKWNENELLINQGDYTFEVKISNISQQKLLAPNKGQMERVIHENISCTAMFKFYYQNRLLFNESSNQASFEFVE